MKNKPNGTILIVDDDPVYVDFLVALLEDEYILFTAKNGYTAISVAMSEMPDLILMDVMMPGMTGYETVLALRYLNETKKTPVIFIAGEETPEEKKRVFQFGAVDYLFKNACPDDIKMRVSSQIYTEAAAL